ncbi:MAG TPA: hypothetical protein VGF69_20995 [Thermoanaerobaculia bacterium]|jgi:ascorbate-specific PTS system EIIC-type component UlaA
MTTYETEHMSLRDTAKGIAVRAGVLSVATLIGGAFLFSLAAKAASGLVKIIVGAILLAIGAGVVTWEVKKVQRRFGRPHPTNL